MTVFEEVGGFDTAYGIGGYEDDDLCRRIVASGQRLLIAHESFVHHDGHQTFDANGLDWYAEQETNRDRFESRFGLGRSSRDVAKVSACLITKDEEANIATCLASLDGFADEIVVYDTGSTDDTVSMARELGATVIEGYWDDDFSRARNAALEHCTGEWIAWLDADETLVCDDVAGLLPAPASTWTRRWTASPFPSTTSPGSASDPASSIRPAGCSDGPAASGRADSTNRSPVGATIGASTRWPWKAPGSDTPATSMRPCGAATRRSGTYGWPRPRWTRPTAGRRGSRSPALGRAYLTAGRFEEAFDNCREALEHTDNLITRRLATRTAAEALTHLGRLDEALEWIDRLRQISTSAVQADIAEGKIRLTQGEFQQALDLFDRVGRPPVR